MHFIVIAAFALVLSARTPTRSWWLFDATWLTYVVVAGQVVVIVLLAAASSLWVVRRLGREPWNADPAQRLFARFGMVLRTLLLMSIAVDVLLTPWMVVVRNHWRLKNLIAIDDLVALTPFFLGAILCWTAQYPAERAIRALAADRGQDGGGRRIWRLGEYLLFNIRFQLLLMVVPMTGFLAAYDLADKYSMQLYRWTHFDYAEQAALMVAAGLMFLISPVILRYVWSTRVLPPTALRERLQRICNRIRMRYREILIWQSDGVVVNGCVMGLLPAVRYILLSDGLLETMKDEQVEAVFGHEAGHVKHLHLHFLFLFAALSMLLVGGVLLLIWTYVPYQDARKWLSVSRTEWNSVVDLTAMTMVAICWLFGFGWVSRRFERQADVFGVRCVGDDIESCDRVCRIHHPPDGQKPDRKALCPAAADIFAESLHRIAVLNGIPPNQRSWRHSSIASRMAFVRALAAEPKKLRRFNRIIILTKFILLAGTAAGTALSAYLYWPEQFFKHWFGK